MSKSKLLIDIWMYVNKVKDFTAQEIADEFQISKRTVQRYITDLYEMGVPIEGIQGKYGGYHIENNKLLPPICFSLEETASIIFTYSILNNYISNPYNIEVEKVKDKLYAQLPDYLKIELQEMGQYIKMDVPIRHVQSTYLREILDASMNKNIIEIKYDSVDGVKEKRLVPIGIYSQNGYWYFPALDLKYDRINLFRVDRVLSFQVISKFEKQLSALKNWQQNCSNEKALVCVRYLINKQAARMHQSDWVDYRNYEWSNEFEEIALSIPNEAIPFFAQQLTPLGNGVKVLEPQALVDCLIEKAEEIINTYK
ncbi:helix-turn-helix transcriptional regulator [Dielma fastidiosa]|uniref:helix-turn-helix transcriptional regulator n=1 Tax=Dielma fastidiosa TaxID=1034346 RepID=UPI000E4A4170|nr:YafY family protein [Dielma fastidiosa]RHN00822.1 YafY family transcriptional regulator [Dielma fastidiosa]